MDEVAEAIEKYQGLVPLVYDIETMGLEEARPQDMQYAVYLKREADKVIAELKESVKGLILDNYLKDKEIRHHKYKRCLAMASACTNGRDYSDSICYRRAIRFYARWEKIWLELAEKFKEAK